MKPFDQQPKTQLEPFSWKSRADLCKRLVDLLDSAPPPAVVEAEPDYDCWYERTRVAELIALCADLTCASLLRHVLNQSGEIAEVRNLMIYALAAVKSDFTLAELKPLLWDRDLSPSWLMSHCRTPEARELAAQAISDRLAEDAANGGAYPQSYFTAWYPASGPRRDPIEVQVPEEFQALRDQLCDQYMAAPAVGEANDQDAIDAQLYLAAERYDRPESRELFLERWRGARDASEREGLTWVCPHPSLMIEWILDAPPSLLDTLHAVRTYAWKQPHEVARLVAELYGDDEVLLCIEEQFRAASRGDTAAWALATGAEWYFRYRPGEMVGERLVALIVCPDIYHSLKPNLRRAFRERIWSFSPEQAFSVLNEILDCPNADPEFIRDGLVRVVLEPRPEHRELLFRVLETSDPGRADWGLRFAALQTLEQLGEDGPDWVLRLETLASDSDICLRLLASAFLIRRGAPERLAGIVEAARTWPPSEDHLADRAQGLAVRLLGELAPDEHVELFKSLVQTEGELEHNLSAPQEAAYALACIATPVAVVTLARAYVSGEEYLSRAIHQYLPAAIDHLEGRSVQLLNRIPIWRYALFPP